METKNSNLALREVVDGQKPNPLLGLLDDEKVKLLVDLLKEAQLISDDWRNKKKMAYFVTSRNPKSAAAAYQVLSDYLDEDANDSGKFERFYDVSDLLRDLKNYSRDTLVDSEAIAWGESLERDAGLSDEGIINSIARGVRKAVGGVKAVFSKRKEAQRTPYFAEMVRLYNLKSRESTVEITYQALSGNCNAHACLDLEKMGCLDADMKSCLAEAYKMVFGKKFRGGGDWSMVEHFCMSVSPVVTGSGEISRKNEELRLEVNRRRIKQVVETAFAKYCALKAVGQYRGSGVFKIN